MKRFPRAAYLAALMPCAVYAQTAATDGTVTLDTVKVEASADASAQGLAPAFSGGQVATGARAGILGTTDNLKNPFQTTSYTNDLIMDRQARSVADVLQNDPGVRVARGFGNFQESYFIRGFILSSEDTAYNGLYGLLPRQYIASELFERVEVLRGASTFLTGASPSGGGIGGAINIVPKRAPNEPLNRITTGISSGGQAQVSADIARRFGPDDSTGIRLNVGQRGGETGVDDEYSRTTVAMLGLDWHNDRLRLSADLGYQFNRIKGGRPNVTLNGATTVPDAPKNSRNYGQDWSYSNERDVFGTLRGEYDITDKLTAYAAYGHRNSSEANSLANVTVTNGSTGAGSFYRFDNTRKDKVDTGEIGLRGKLATGPVNHELVLSASYFELEKKNAYGFDFGNRYATNIYDPVKIGKPDFTSTAGFGNDLGDPALNGRTRMTSVAIGDTLSMLDDSVRLTVGVRHQRLYTRSWSYDTTGGSNITGQDPYDQSRNSPAAAIVWRVTPAVSLYANYIESLAQGDSASSTLNGLPVTNAGQMLRPYVAKQKEIGVKYENDGFGAGLALFSTDKPRSYYQANGSSYTFTQSGKDRHRGAELTVYGEVAPSVRILGGVTWLDAKQLNTGSDTTDGNRVIGVPRYQANLGAEWDIPGVQGLTVDGRVVYTGASYADAKNDLRVPSWTRVDAGLRYVTEMGGNVVTWRARVENLFNRSYWASVGGYPNSGYLVLGAPRLFTLTATMEF